MMTRGLLLAGTALALVLAPAANAADSKKTQNRTPTNQELLERIEKLEQKQDDSKEDQRSQSNRLSTLEQQFGDVTWTFTNGRPTIQTGDGRFQMSLRGRFHVDTAYFMQDRNLPAAVTARDLSSGVVVRRAQFGVEGRAFKDFWYEMRFDFGGSDTEGSGTVNLMRLAYQGIPNFRVNLGVIQPIFTAVDATSSNEITFIERADVINTILDIYGGSDARRGAEMTFQKQDMFYGGDNLVISGAFTGSKIGAARGFDEGTQALGRVAYRLWSDGPSNVQIGVDGAKVLSVTGNAPPGGTARLLQLRDRPEIRVDGTRLVDTGTIPATGGWLYGVEGGANFRNFYVQGEWYKFGIERDFNGATPAVIAAGDPEFSGWYVEGSWIITGEPKGYAASSNSNNVGAFGAPRVIKPFSLSGNSWGAWELAARYSVLDLNFNEGLPGVATPSGGIRGGEEKIWTAGVNWYMNNNVRVMFNYLNIDVDRLTAAGAQQGQTINAVAGRMQFAF